MASIIRNLIEYTGIIDNPENLYPKYFRQLNLKENQVLPSSKPDIQQIIKVMSEVEIKNTRIINTPKGRSLGGQVLTGKKLIVDGIINEKIEYMADEPSQGVHIVNFKPYFSTSIIVPDTIIVQSINVIGYIEDISVEVSENKKNINTSISLLLDTV